MKLISWKPGFHTFALTAVLVFIGAIAPLIYAQNNYGTVRGRVTDASGAVVPNANIILTNDGTEIARFTKTNQAGDYFYTAVEPGTYTVVISAANFKKIEHTGIVVDLEQAVTIDETLAIGSAGETIEVTGTEPLIDTANASEGQLITSEQLDTLPNQGRNPYTAVKLANNVTPVGTPLFVRFEDQNGTDAVAIAGAPVGANGEVVDGIPTSTSSGGTSFIPGIEAISDLKIQANTYDAEVGRVSGGVYDTSLKSGTKTYHGELFGLTRQDPFLANSWWNNHVGVAKPDYTQYQTSAAFGGPAPFSNKLPFLRKTFFWATDDNYRDWAPGTAQDIIPTLAERTGDFSADGITLYDPTKPLGTPFAGNQIPSNYFNLIGQAILNTYPTPTPTTAQGYNLVGSANTHTRGDEYIVKLDHQVTPWWASSVSDVFLKTDEPGGNALKTIAASRQNEIRHIKAVAWNNVITLNPTTILTVAYGYVSYWQNTPQFSNGFNQTNGFNGYGFPESYVSLLQSQSYPTISPSSQSDQTGLGAANRGNVDQIQTSYVAGISKTLGKQTLKAGYVFRKFSYYNAPQTAGNGSFTFNGEFTTKNGIGGTTANGPQAWADLLLGLPSTQSIQVNPVSQTGIIQYHALYAQDDLRLTKKLTANVGLRYEYELGVREKDNQYNVGFDTNAEYLFPASTGAVQARGGLAFAGQNGYPTHSGDLNRVKLSPRVGISYEVRPGTVVHGGFGVFYGPVGIPYPLPSTGYTQVSTVTVATATGNLLASQVGPGGSLSTPFNSGSQVLKPSGNALGYLTGAGQSLSVPAFNQKYPYVQQYSLSVQQQLPGKIVFELGYAGAHGRNQPRNVNINQLPDSILAQYAPGGVHAGTNLSTQVTNPYYAATVGGYPSTGIIANKKVALAQTLLPFPQFSSVTVAESTGHSNYNALDVKLQERFNYGLTVLIAYTWSSNWNNFNNTPVTGSTAAISLNPTAAGPQDNYSQTGEYARAVTNMPNRFTAAVTYELPVGHGKKYLGNSNRLVDAVIGGWKVDDVTIIENGGPIQISQTDLSSSSNFGTTGVGGSIQRPNLIPGVNPCLSGNPKNRLGGPGGTSYFNLAAFTPALPYTYGNAPRTLPCQVPGLNQSDVSLSKNFKLRKLGKLGERANLEFRAEALNVFNTPELGDPGAVLTTASGPSLTSVSFAPSTTTTQKAGIIGGQLDFSRVVQFGARFRF